MWLNERYFWQIIAIWYYYCLHQGLHSCLLDCWVPNYYFDMIDSRQTGHGELKVLRVNAWRQHTQCIRLLQIQNLVHKIRCLKIFMLWHLPWSVQVKDYSIRYPNTIIFGASPWNKKVQFILGYLVCTNLPLDKKITTLYIPLVF